MKKTLLRLVQNMVNSIDSESITSVGDTEESSMCVDIINRAYEFMMSGKRWRHLRLITSLTSGTELNVLLAPTGTIGVSSKDLYYNKKRVRFLTPEDFLAKTRGRDATVSTITKMGEFLVHTDRDPTFWTSDDDETLVFDGVPDATNGLNASLSQVIIWRLPTSELTADGQIFDLPPQVFPALQELGIAWAALELNKDGATHTIRMRNYTKLMNELLRLRRFIDTEDDLRDKIIARIPRSTRRRITTTD